MKRVEEMVDSDISNKRINHLWPQVIYKSGDRSTNKVIIHLFDRVFDQVRLQVEIRRIDR